MYKTFTEEARGVMLLANYEAQKRRHEYIGTEHILYAIIEEGKCDAFAVLRWLNVVDSITLDLNSIIRNGLVEISLPGKLPLIPRAKTVLALATQWGSKRSFQRVETEDLLFALIEEAGGAAGQVLIKNGVTIETVQETLKKLGLHPHDNLPEEDTEFRREISALKKALRKPDISDIEAIKMATQDVYALWSTNAIWFDDDEDIEATL